jgi:hypothetical protein
MAGMEAAESPHEAWQKRGSDAVIKRRVGRLLACCAVAGCGAAASSGVSRDRRSGNSVTRTRVEEDRLRPHGADGMNVRSGQNGKKFRIGTRLSHAAERRRANVAPGSGPQALAPSAGRGLARPGQVACDHLTQERRFFSSHQVLLPRPIQPPPTCRVSQSIRNTCTF